MKDFLYWKTRYEKQQLVEFSLDTIGLLWLKIKSILRKDLVAEFILTNNITINEKRLASQFEELFYLLSRNPEIGHDILNKFIITKSEYQAKIIDINFLVSELYKMKIFEWGGDYQNSLDKHLVSRYVKVFKSYDVLFSKLENEINISVQGYVMNSWYNHWTSILIEHIFKSHPIVLPTVGQIKSVDFFIYDIPFDLKVTYLPNEFIKFKRKERGLPVELTFLKNKAREADIYYDKKAKDNVIYHEIFQKMKDKGDDFCKDALSTLKMQKMNILNEVTNSPKILAKWLYENQGEMRFGSENRLFIVLVDAEDFNSSWKLKRNLDLLKPAIYSYIDEFKNKNLEDMKISFSYKGNDEKFYTYTDIIFVIK